MTEMERNHWWYKGRREIIGTLLSPFLKCGNKILDAGCGAGGTMEYMLKYGCVVGVDISPEMVEHCRNIGLSAYCEGVERLPFENHSFDLVLCLDVLEHLPDERPALHELKRVVRPGGMLVFTVPAFRWLWGRHDELNNHYRRYNFGELINLLKKSNLRVERTTYFNFFLLPSVWLVRRLGRVLNFTNKTDLELGTGIMNQLLLFILKIELGFLKIINFPVGVSQIVVAKKEEIDEI
ncbi:class I SAM-dependent methyltransferase [Desulforamulus reducens]|nr:class I SAM-dependent methyltransferase [Desulforamulus reducens]